MLCPRMLLRSITSRVVYPCARRTFSQAVQTAQPHKISLTRNPVIVPRMVQEDKVEVALVQVKGGDNSLRHVRELIFEYTQFLLQKGCDVGSFQDLEVELKDLPGRYSREFGGCLYVLYPGQSLYVQGSDVVHREEIVAKEGALKDADAIACVAVKALPGQDGVCEMKRMYVRPQYRRMGIGKLLAREVLRESNKAGLYKSMKLDSLERLPEALALYKGFGFRPCGPYVPNPESDAVFLEKGLPGLPPPAAQDIETAATIFAEARRVPSQAVSPLPEVTSIAQAYDIHAAMIRSGDAVSGWKVGATNETAIKRMGLTDAFRGPLFSAHIRRGPCTIAWEELGAAMTAVEAEFAFRMNTCLPPRPEPYTEDEVWAAVRSLIPAIEIAATRCPSALPAGPATSAVCIADFALNGVLVLGKDIPISLVPRDSLAECSAIVSKQGPKGGGMSAEGKGMNVMGNPLKSLVWLVNSLRTSGITLEEGAVVTTGAAALLTSDQVPWGSECILEAKIGNLPPAAGDASVKITLPAI